MTQMTRKDYYEKHAICPSCGSNETSQTYAGYIFDQSAPDSYKDENQSICKCGWSGIVHDMVQTKLIERMPHQPSEIDETMRLAEAAGFEVGGKNVIWESVICTEELESLIKLVRAEQSAEIVAMRIRITELESALRYAIEDADGWHDESGGGPIEGDDEMDAARKLIGI